MTCDYMGLEQESRYNKVKTTYTKGSTEACASLGARYNPMMKACKSTKYKTKEEYGIKDK